MQRVQLGQTCVRVCLGGVRWGVAEGGQLASVAGAPSACPFGRGACPGVRLAHNYPHAQCWHELTFTWATTQARHERAARSRASTRWVSSERGRVVAARGALNRAELLLAHPVLSTSRSLLLRPCVFVPVACS